jgi:sec-independent protein translocase protein TatA
MQFGGIELVIVLVIVILLFGPGRLSKIAGEIGTGIKSFKDGISGKDDKKDDPNPPKPEG